MTQEEYFNELESLIREQELLLPAEDRMDNRLLEIWLKELKAMCDKCYLDYVRGERESFMISELEYDKTFDDAGMQFTSEVLNSLIDKGMIEVSVGEDGDLLYSATDYGKKIAKNYEKK